jgi:thiosulfate reductase cytochrome b subunit
MKKIYLHPLPLRMWHWANALIVILLLTTGIMLRIPGVATFPANSAALRVHRYLGWAMTISFGFWFAYALGSGHLRHQYTVRKKDFKETFRQAGFYLFSIFRGKENPFQPSLDEKFNPLQKISYGAIMLVFTPVVVVTGLLFSDILPFRKYILLYDAVKGVDATHVIVAYVFALYIVIHVYMSTLGRNPLSHIKAMVLGYEEEPDEPKVVSSDTEQADEPERDISHPVSTTAMVSGERTVACQECLDKQEGEKDHG